MPRCQWCGKFTNQPEVLQYGRSQLVLCPLCDSERQFRDQPSLELPKQSTSDKVRSFWRKIREKFPF